MQFSQGYHKPGKFYTLFDVDQKSPVGKPCKVWKNVNNDKKNLILELNVLILK